MGLKRTKGICYFKIRVNFKILFSFVTKADKARLCEVFRLLILMSKLGAEFAPLRGSKGTFVPEVWRVGKNPPRKLTNISC